MKKTFATIVHIRTSVGSFAIGALFFVVASSVLIASGCRGPVKAPGAIDVSLARRVISEAGLKLGNQFEVVFAAEGDEWSFASVALRTTTRVNDGRITQLPRQLWPSYMEGPSYFGKLPKLSDIRQGAWVTNGMSFTVVIHRSDRYDLVTITRVQE